jgi:hypothetical protein
VGRIGQDADGEPIIQGQTIRFPVLRFGDRTGRSPKPFIDPTRYGMRRRLLSWCCPAGCAAAERALISLPFSTSETARVPSRFLEMSARDRIGEGLAALAENLGIRSMRETAGRVEAFCISASRLRKRKAADHRGN